MSKVRITIILFTLAISLTLFSNRGNAQSSDIAELFQNRFYEDTIVVKDKGKFWFADNNGNVVNLKLKKTEDFLMIGISAENDLFTGECTPPVELSVDGISYFPVVFEHNWNSESATGVCHSEKMGKSNIYVRLFSPDEMSSTLFIAENNSAICQKSLNSSN